MKVPFWSVTVLATFLVSNLGKKRLSLAHSVSVESIMVRKSRGRNMSKEMKQCSLTWYELIFSLCSPAPSLVEC